MKLFNSLNFVNGAQWKVAHCASPLVAHRTPPRPCEQKIQENLKIFMYVPPYLVHVNIIALKHDNSLWEFQVLSVIIQFYRKQKDNSKNKS